MKKVLFGLLSLALVATACKKSKDAPALTKENVAGAYMLEKVTFKYGSSGEQDITAGYVDDCEKDDIVTLKTDFTYDSKDAGQECSGDYTGTWGLPAANKFELDGDQYDVAKWDGNTLAISQAYDFGGNNGTIIIYMKK